MLNSIICKLLGIKYPLIQGGMAWIADAELASAVSNAGALGVIAAGYAPGEWVKEEIRKTKGLTEKPFGLNIMLLNPNADEIARIAVEEGVKVVITGAGNPGKYIKMWKENNVLVFPVIPSVALAVRMERAGADAVIAEGSEAGGHVGELTTMSLIPQVADAINIPVLAAGGIADGRGLAAAWMLGASGFQVGTRFLVARECNVHKNYKQKILAARDTSTIVTGRPTGHPVRIIKNKLARDFQELEKRNASLEEYEELGKSSLYRAAREGDMDHGSIMAGQSAGLVKKEQTCKEIIEEIFSEAKKIIVGKAKLI
ncbi:MAG: enoyl-[acyl-carrier-protein] reductase FabK [Candidatus Caldatribacteriota bacterium]|nr:enoyl-[acyl-carrier-protein] reductase FabK [Candidatus Caldatribacteriota bacterium]